MLRTTDDSPLSIAIASEGLVSRSVRVAASDVVFVKGLVEASEGLAAVFAERGGELTLSAPAERLEELDALLADLTRDVGARVSVDVSSVSSDTRAR